MPSHITLKDFVAELKRDTSAEVAPSSLATLSRVGRSDHPSRVPRLAKFRDGCIFYFFAVLIWYGFLKLGYRMPYPLFYFFMALPGVVISWQIVWHYKRERASARRAIDSALDAREPIPLRTLTIAIRDKRCGTKAAEHLVSRSADLTDDEMSELRPQELRNLLWLLIPVGWKKRPLDWRVVIAICKVLGHSSFGPALWPLGRVADGILANDSVPKEVREQAAKAAEAVRHRILQSAHAAGLLRAASTTDDPSSLLRPATEGETEPDRLLRPAQPNDAP